jgi:hypothetical protein
LLGKAQMAMHPLMVTALKETIAELQEAQQQRLPPWLRMTAAGDGGKAKGKKKK